jgi:hypothetical protein
VVVLALITRGFKAAPPEMTATERRRLRQPPDGRRLAEVRLIKVEGRTVRIALGQLESGTDVQANLAAIDRFAAAAAREGAALVAFPEYATYEKKKVDATFPEVAEPLDGPVCQELSRTARRHPNALVAGVVENKEEPGNA